MATEKQATPRDVQLVAKAVSSLIAGLHETYYGAKPREVRTYLDERYVICVIIEPFTSYEKQLLSQVSEGMTIAQMWALFEGAVGKRFKGAVAEYTDREVVCFVSQAHADPDRVVLCFELAEDRAADAA